MAAQLGLKLRSIEGGFSHWCPACHEMHGIFTAERSGPRWTFNGDWDLPSFAPSMKITGKRTVVVDGEWTGEWVRGPDGKALDMCCHYYLTAGKLIFQADCTHALAGQTVPLPDLPGFISD